MASYKIEWKSSVRKDLKRVDRKFVPKLIDDVAALADNPFPVDSQKLFDTERTYRVRSGDYRIIYQVDIKHKMVLVMYIRHRKDVYKKMSR